MSNTPVQMEAGGSFQVVKLNRRFWEELGIPWRTAREDIHPDLEAAGLCRRVGRYLYARPSTVIGFVTGELDPQRLRRGRR